MGKPKKIESYRTQRVGIISPYNTVWTPNTFETEDKARAYLSDFWRGDHAAPLKKYRFVPVLVTVTPIVKNSAGTSSRRSKRAA